MTAVTCINRSPIDARPQSRHANHRDEAYVDVIVKTAVNGRVKPIAAFASTAGSLSTKGTSLILIIKCNGDNWRWCRGVLSVERIVDFVPLPFCSGQLRLRRRLEASCHRYRQNRRQTTQFKSRKNVLMLNRLRCEIA
jgi:hypothetical protein